MRVRSAPNYWNFVSVLALCGCSLLLNLQASPAPVYAHRIESEVLTDSTLQAAGVQSVDDASRHDIILLLDNSRSMAFRFDIEDKRDRFARFLVRFLQAFASENTSIGIANFAARSETAASGVTPLVPLTQVVGLSQTDTRLIHSLNCPSADSKQAQTPGDPCYGTQLVAALDWAESQLDVCLKDMHNKCDIILFTDGKLNEPNSDTASDVNQRFAEMPSNINLFSAFFDKSLAESPDNDTFWQVWKSAVDDYLLDAANTSAEEVYRAALGFVGLASQFATLSSVHLSQTGTTVELVPGPPLDVKLLNVDLLSDLELSEVFSSPPDVSLPTRRVWLLPDFDKLMMTLSGHGIAFYRVYGETEPVQVKISVLPQEQTIGRPVQVLAIAHTAGRVLTNTQKLSIHVYTEPGSTNLDLQPDEHGLWIGELDLTEPGTYTVTATLEPLGWQLTSKPIVGEATLAMGQFVSQRVRLNVKPNRQILGWPVQFEVSFYSGNELARLPANSNVRVVLQPNGLSYPLALQDGLWQTTQVLTQTGNLTVSVTTDNPYWGPAAVSGNLHILPSPKLISIKGDEIPGLSMHLQQLPVYEANDLFVFTEIPGGNVNGVTYDTLRSDIYHVTGIFGNPWYASWTWSAFGCGIIIPLSLFGYGKLSRRRKLDRNLEKALQGDEEALKNIVTTETAYNDRVLKELIEHLSMCPELWGKDPSGDLT